MSNEISSRQLTELAEKIYRYLSRDIIKQGLDYFKQNHVLQIEYNNSIISSTVNGSRPYSVLIYLNDFTNSTCSCQKKNFCKHIAATFFHIYTKINTPRPDAQTKQTPTKKQAGLSGKIIAGKRKPAPEGPVEVWYDIFEQEYELVRQSVKRYFKPFIDHEYYNHFYKVYDEFQKNINVHYIGWSEEFQTLYQAFATLFILTRLEEASWKYDRLHWEHYFIEDYEKDLVEKFPIDLYQEHYEKFMPFLQKALEIIRNRLFQQNNPLFDWLLIYRCMYPIFCYDPEWLKTETTRLEEIMKKADKNHRHHYNAAIGLAHFKFQAEQADEALIILRQLDYPRLDDLHYYLYFFYTTEKWDQLYQWLAWLASGMENNRDDLEGIFEYCVDAAERSPNAEKFIQMIKLWLPHSLEYYAELLLNTKRYQDWAELRICYWSASGEEAIKEEAHLVEAREPAALLPLYHQWVVRLIEGRNRKAYQSAVKILKKLRAIYKKQKKIRDWNAYILQLADHHARMKAFQDELRKGSLISS